MIKVLTLLKLVLTSGVDAIVFDVEAPAPEGSPNENGGAFAQGAVPSEGIVPEVDSKENLLVAESEVKPGDDVGNEDESPYANVRGGVGSESFVALDSAFFFSSLSEFVKGIVRKGPNANGEAVERFMSSVGIVVVEGLPKEK
jgi:hypothetical protein